MKITVVKKVKADGNLCRKSASVWEQLQQEKLLNKLDRIIFAHETKSDSEGMILAAQYQVTRAPFFIVQQDDNSTQIYTSYEDFLFECLDYQLSTKSEIPEIGSDYIDPYFI